jgi:hypothetical protein
MVVHDLDIEGVAGAEHLANRLSEGIFDPVAN